MSTVMYDTCQYIFFIRSNFLLRPPSFPVPNRIFPRFGRQL